MRNPKGISGPRIKERIARKAEEILKRPGKRGYTHADGWVEALDRLALEGDLGAISQIFDRLEGKPTQKTELTGAGGGALKIIVRHVDGQGLDLPPLEAEGDQE